MIENISAEMKQEILTDLMKTRAPSRTSKNLGYDIRIVLSVMESESGSDPSFEQRYDGFGRPDLSPFLVARKKAWGVWDNDDPKIADARDKYEQGTHEMATGRDGDWLILYSIPRKNPDPRPGYFLPEISL